LDHPVAFSVIGIAALTGRDKATVSRAAADGRFGRKIKGKGRLKALYRLSEIERATGKKFTHDQVAIAAAAHDPQPPARSALLLEFAGAVLALRDRDWQDHLASQGLIAGDDYRPLPPTQLPQPRKEIP